MSATAGATGADERQLRATLIVVGAGAFLSVLELTVVNVSLDTLEEELGGSITSVQWVVTAYLLALAAVVPLTGWLSRRFGPRTLYIWSLALFTVASVLCALAWSVGSLVAFRVLQGMGGGALLPVAQTLAARAAGPANMRKAMATIGSVGVIAPVIGPVVGGVLVDQLSWHWIFLMNLPFGVAGLLLARRMLPADEKDAEVVGTVDWLGLACVSIGLPLVTFALTELGQGTDPVSPKGFPLMVVGLGLLAFFVVHALRVAHPLLNLHLYANRTFAISAIAMTALGGTLFGPYLLMPLFFQDVRGDTAIEAGLLFGSQGLGAATAIWSTERLHRLLSGPRLAVLGSTMTAVFTVPLTFFDQDTPVVAFVADLALRGFGVGLVFVPIFSIALSQLKRSQLADATAQINVLQRVGGAVVTAVIAVLLSYELGRHAAGDVAGMADAYQATWRWTLILHVAAIIPTVMLLRLSRRTPTVLPAEP